MVKDPIQRNRDALESTQKDVNRLVSRWKNGRLSGLSNPVQAQALEAVCIRQAFEQQVIVSDDLHKLRVMPRLRSSFTDHAHEGAGSLSPLNLSKRIVLEGLAAHSVGTVVTEPCARCRAGQGHFRECIKASGQDGTIFLKGKCTNCAISNLPCDSAPR